MYGKVRGAMNNSDCIPLEMHNNAVDSDDSDAHHVLLITIDWLLLETSAFSPPHWNMQQHN